MKISKEAIFKFKKLLDTCNASGMTSLIIEPNKVRAINAEQTALFVQEISIFDQDVIVGIMTTPDSARVPSLRNKLDSVIASENLTVELIEDKNQEASPTPISGFKISGGGAKFDFKASRVDFIKAPKSLNDTFIWSFSIEKETLDFLEKAASTFSVKNVAIVSKGSGEISIEITDKIEVSDSFSLVVADSAEWIGEDDPEIQAFVYYYDWATFKTLLKNSIIKEPKKPKEKTTKKKAKEESKPEEALVEEADQELPKSNFAAEIKIGRNGSGLITLNDIDVVMLPREE